MSAPNIKAIKESVRAEMEQLGARHIKANKEAGERRSHTFSTDQFSISTEKAMGAWHGMCALTRVAQSISWEFGREMQARMTAISEEGDKAHDDARIAAQKVAA